MTALCYMITSNIFSYPTTSTVHYQRHFRVLQCKATKKFLFDRNRTKDAGGLSGIQGWIHIYFILRNNGNKWN